jgi:hypothetical protein
LIRSGDIHHVGRHPCLDRSLRQTTSRAGHEHRHRPLQRTRGKRKLFQHVARRVVDVDQNNIRRMRRDPAPKAAGLGNHEDIAIKAVAKRIDNRDGAIPILFDHHHCEFRIHRSLEFRFCRFSARGSGRSPPAPPPA